MYAKSISRYRAAFEIPWSYFCINSYIALLKNAFRGSVTDGRLKPLFPGHSLWSSDDTGNIFGSDLWNLRLALMSWIICWVVAGMAMISDRCKEMSISRTWTVMETIWCGLQPRTKQLFEGSKISPCFKQSSKPWEAVLLAIDDNNVEQLFQSVQTILKVFILDSSLHVFQRLRSKMDWNTCFPFQTLSHPQTGPHGAGGRSPAQLRLVGRQSWVSWSVHARELGRSSVGDGSMGEGFLFCLKMMQFRRYLLKIFGILFGLSVV